ncbi:MAG: hypothetical protein J0H20_20975, partial [Rhizobiales bacterium]|nr:hypothetical protein [Hyphomicrobiales bacterium]
LWPWGSGKISRPPRASVMFMPERPYVPDGSLRAALTYPSDPAGFRDEVLTEAMQRVGLGRLAGSLDRKARWGKEISYDDEERLTFARLLLLKPRWVFTEQTIDGLDENQRGIFTSIINQDLAGSAVVTVSDRATTSDFYTRTINLVDTAPPAPAPHSVTALVPTRAIPDEQAKQAEPSSPRPVD